jgi:hypothetical protein
MAVRSIHHVIHNYIKGNIAREITGLTDLSDYDSIHALGTYDDDEGVRSVMADRNAYIGRAESGTCSGDDPDWSGTAPTGVDDIYFSSCTKDALRRSANDEEGVDHENLERGSCGPTVPAGSYTCYERSSCPDDTTHASSRDDNCGSGERCCRSSSGTR